MLVRQGFDLGDLKHDPRWERAAKSGRKVIDLSIFVFRFITQEESQAPPLLSFRPGSRRLPVNSVPFKTAETESGEGPLHFHKPRSVAKWGNPSDGE